MAEDTGGDEDEADRGRGLPEGDKSGCATTGSGFSGLLSGLLLLGILARRRQPAPAQAGEPIPRA